MALSVQKSTFGTWVLSTSSDSIREKKKLKENLSYDNFMIVFIFLFS